MSLHLYNTQLTDRVLWYDGDSTYDSTNILQLIKKGISVKWVDKITPDITSYNALSSTPIGVKTKSNPIDTSWNLPSPYDTLDPFDYVMDKHYQMIQHMDPQEQSSRETRLAQELVKYKEMNLIDVLRAVIYVINTLTSCNAIWGIGRGSSVSSYVLYVIGVHDVDSFTYNLDIDDFLHE